MKEKKLMVDGGKKKFLLISFIVAILVVLIFLIFYSPAKEALFGKAAGGGADVVNWVSCTDYDSGINLGQASYVSVDFRIGSLNYRVRRSDSCVGNQVKEYYCDVRRHRFSILGCPNGQSCDADACVEDALSLQGVCGDGIRNGPEECDDGNVVNGDGCNSNCQNEVGEVPPPPSAGDSANLIAFTRGIAISEVLNSIQISQGSIWVVDPDGDANPNPVRLTPVENAGSIMPSWSPNKDKIVFASNRGRTANAGDLTPFLDLWTVNVDGSDLMRITSQEGHDWTPAWSPDGNLIAYASTADPSKLDKDNVDSLDIWVVGADGSNPNPRMIADNGGQDEDPVFSADGNTIYYVAATGACFAIWQVGIDGSGNMPVRDVSGQTICGEDPSVSGNTLYYWYNGQLVLLNFNSAGDSTGFPFPGSSDAIEPWISPDGTRFTYIRNFLNGDGSYNDGGDIYVSHLNGQYPKSVTSGQNDFFPRWS